jgi:uncharacterized protein (TIGR02145 family)
MFANPLIRCRASWMVALCFFCLVSLQAWPATEQNKSSVGQNQTTQAASENPGFFEKEEPVKAKMNSKRRFPLLVVLGAALAVGAVVYFLVSKKSSEEDQPLVIRPAGTVTDFDGNVYQTVQIGDQVWMAENLKSTHYSDGSPISSLAYNSNEANAQTYGRLYAPEAFMRGAAGSGANPSGVQGAAPRGWHIPSPAEWQKLIAALGGAAIAGGKMKEGGMAHWLSPNSGATNESLFAALPAGMRRADLLFQWLATRCVFASSQRNSHDQTIVMLLHDSTDARMEGFHPDDAVSVRCVKD